MKSIFDRSFKYVPSFDTNVKKTIERVRRELKEKAERDEANKREADLKVQKMERKSSHG